MSNNLAVSQVTSAQLNKEVTQNTGHGQLDAAITERSVFTVTSSNALTLTDAEFRGANFLVFDDGGATGPGTITVSAIKRGFFAVANNLSFTLRFEITGQPVLDVQAAGETVIWYCDGINCFLPRANTLSSVSIATPVAPAQAIPGFRGATVTKTTAQLNVGGGGVKATWDQESFDTDDFHDNSVNNNRLTIPAGSNITKVVVGCNIEWAQATSDFTFVRINKNAAAFIEGASNNFAAANADPRNSLVSAPIEVVDGDWFEVEVNQDAGADIAAGSSNFWIMVIESTGNGTTLGHPPFEGARVYKSVDQNIPTSAFTVMAWDLEEFDTSVFHDNATNNSRFTIPTGVTKIRLRVAFQYEGFTGGGGVQGDIGGHFLKNGSRSFRGNTEMHHLTTNSGASLANLGWVSSVIDCIAGDFFEVAALQGYGVNKDIQEDSGFSTWFEIEVIERVSSPHYDLETYHSGTPTSSQLIRRWSIPRTMILPDAMTDSAAYADTAPSGQTDFDVQRNGVSVGTIRFPNATKAATFIQSGDDTFSPGDRLEIVAPGALNSIADISFAIAFRRAF